MWIVFFLVKLYLFSCLCACVFGSKPIVHMLIWILFSYFLRYYYKWPRSVWYSQNPKHIILSTDIHSTHSGTCGEKRHIDHVLKRTFFSVWLVHRLLLHLCLFRIKIITAFNTLIILIKFIIEISFTGTHCWWSTYVLFLSFFLILFIFNCCLHSFLHSFHSLSMFNRLECGRRYGFRENQQEENRNIKHEREWCLTKRHIFLDS